MVNEPLFLTVTFLAKAVVLGGIGIVPPATTTSTRGDRLLLVATSGMTTQSSTVGIALGNQLDAKYQFVSVVPLHSFLRLVTSTVSVQFIISVAVYVTVPSGAAYTVPAEAPGT